MKNVWQEHYDPGVPTSLSYPEWTLYEMLMETVQRYPDYTAIHFNEIEITYQALLERVDALAAGLKALGLKRGDGVALFLPNSPTYVIAHYAVVKLGAIVCNINIMNHGKELTRLLDHSDATMVITLDLFLKTVIDSLANTPVQHLIIHSVFGMESELEEKEALPPLHHVNQLIETHKGSLHDPECRLDDIAVLQYTSGVTGDPKAAILTHRTIVSNIIQIDAWQVDKTAENRAVICIIPFFHVFGMTICMHVSVFCGYKMVLFPQFDWSSVIQIIDAIRLHKPISFPAVSSLWAALVSSSELKRMDLAPIEIASGGGAPLSEWVQQRYHELTGNYIAQAYGLSEVSSTALICPFKKGSITESVGLPLPDTDVKIMDIDTGRSECNPGEIGELVIRGPQVMKGYWKDEARTRSSLRDGWLYTGDLGYMNEQGYFFLVDRKDDMIITRGYNVYPSQVEEVLARHPDIREAVVVGCEDALRGQSITAFLVAREGNKPDHKTMSAYCRQYLADYQVPRTFKYRDELPKNKIGKPLRRILRAEVSNTQKQRET